MRLPILVIASFFLIASSVAFAGHGGLFCLSCHRSQANQASSGCLVCHPAEKQIFEHAMSTRSGEKAFVARSYGRVDSQFWDKNCSACHLTSCLDCHPTDQGVMKPTVATCQTCHKGYYTGWDYSGRAPREDNMRYQRGLVLEGETFLKMLPDVHYSKGITCGACHSMASLAAGKKSSKGCRDCHMVRSTVLEHSITPHLRKLECYACHSAWAPQEYGTFYLRFRDQKMKEDFDLKPGTSLEYLKSAYLKRQDAPMLGLNSRGMISPIRPLYIAYYTDIMAARNRGPENILLAAEWRAWFPHTIQRGSVTCEGCHDNPSRFLLEPEAMRIYNLQQDGMTLPSFWSQQGQRVVNGNFVSPERYRRISHKNNTYSRGQVKKWKQLLDRVDASSER